MKTIKFGKNKKGWIELLEAAISILLVTIAILVVMNKGYIKNEGLEEEMYTTEIFILKIIQNNEVFREIILDDELIVPVESGETGFPNEIQEEIEKRTPSHLECIGKIGNNEEGCCSMNREVKTDVFSYSTLISGGAEEGRKLILFCWKK